MTTHGRSHTVTVLETQTNRTDQELRAPSKNDALMQYLTNSSHSVNVEFSNVWQMQDSQHSENVFLHESEI